MQTTAIGTVANSLPQNEVILLTLLISKRYILLAELQNNLDILAPGFSDFYITIYILTASFTNFMFIGKLP